MKTFRELFGGHVPPLAPFAEMRLEDAYACESCGWVVEGTRNLHCRKCGSQAIFHVRSFLNATKNRALQRLKLQATINAAKARKARNDLAFLTAPEPPQDAA